MKKNRVLSFMSGFGKPGANLEHRETRSADQAHFPRSKNGQDNGGWSSGQESPTQTQRSSTAGRQRSTSRPTSMIGGYIPPIMDIAPDTIPELFPIFTLLNSHSNKLYQEGYFLKLNDLDVHGKPYSDRSWTECFAQLVGTVLSLWDAAALDAAGEEGEVAPSFINLADASIKMMNTLSTGSTGQALQNVLSISTAGKNRYLLHFSSFHVLTQWTAAIRLSMFENTCLQEAYTGSLIAGKGRTLNNIRQIMTKTVFQTEEWTRVRFGAGTPWRRCWCVVAPPDPKVIKQQTKAAKKSSAYSRSNPVIKGDIKFYETSKITKKTRPIATIRDAYSTYAVYPQSRALIDQSTLIKIEGTISIHSSPEITTDGFVFVMPEVHPAVTGFEMMLRFLFPIYDVFHLYGRPNKLIADTLDTRGLMFALPQEKRYGYLELFDMTSLINTEGSNRWTEQEWRKRMKNTVSEYVSRARENAAADRYGSRPRNRNSLPGRGSLRFTDNESMRSDPSLNRQSVAFLPPDRTDSAPPGDGVVFAQPRHGRSASENLTPPSSRHVAGAHGPSRLSYEHEHEHDAYDEHQPPPPPMHGGILSPGLPPSDAPPGMYEGHYGHETSDSEAYEEAPVYQQVPLAQTQPSVGSKDAPVSLPPAMAHHGASRPGTAPLVAPELRRANSRMSSTTLSQMAAANNPNNRSNGQEYNQAMENQDMGDRPRPSAEFYSQHEAPVPLAYNEQDTRSAPSHSLDHAPAMPPSSSSPPIPAFMPQNFNNGPPGYTATPHQSSHLQAAHASDLRSVSAPNLPLGPAVPAVIQPEPLPKASPSPDRRKSNILRKPVPKPAAQAPQGPQPNSNVQPYQRMAVQNATYRAQPLNDRASETDASSVADYSSQHSDSASQPTARPRSMVLPTGQQIPDRSEQVRTGVLKVAGGNGIEQEVVVGDARYRQPAGPNSPSIDLPNIDFGPTMYVAPEIPVRSKARPQSMVNPMSLSQENLLRMTASQAASGEDRPGTAPDESLPNRRSMAWQPVAGVRPDAAPSVGLTPEEFVQQRNAAGRATPVFAHARPSSLTPPKDTRKRLSKTPPGRIQRQSSGDWSAQYRSSPSPNRPSSRGAAMVLTPPPDYSHRLTAREQEHVARVTNTPLVDLGNPQQHRRQESSGGLVSAIAAREQEKQAMKIGYTSQMVQQAIAQRSSAQPQQHPQTAAYYGANLQPGGLSPNYMSNVPAGYQPDLGHGSSQQFSRQQQQYQQQQQQQQQQTYFQDGYVADGAYRAHSPGAQTQRYSVAAASNPNRLSYQQPPTYQAQATAYRAPRTGSSPGAGRSPNAGHDSYFGQN